MRPHIDVCTWSGALMWLTCLLAVLGLLRCGELTVVYDLTTSERSRRLVRLHHLEVAPEPDATGMRLHIPVTKTQPIRGIDVHYHANSINTALCPMRAWRQYASIRRRQAAWSMLDGRSPLLMCEDGTALGRDAVIQHVRRVLQVAGMAPNDVIRFTGHSFRRGGAQSLRDAGMTIDEIKVAGHWLSDAVRRYLTSHDAMAARLAPLFAKAASHRPGEMRATLAHTRQHTDSCMRVDHGVVGSGVITASRRRAVASWQPAEAQRFRMSAASVSSSSRPSSEMRSSSLSRLPLRV